MLKRSALWAWEFLGWPLVFIPLFGITFESCRFWTGCLVVYVVQVGIAIGYVIRYDMAVEAMNSPHGDLRDDPMGIYNVKRHIRICLGLKDSRSLANLGTATISLSTLIFLVSVPTLYLCYRREGERGFRPVGVLLILVSVVVKTTIYYGPNVVLWDAFVSRFRQVMHLAFGG